VLAVISAVIGTIALLVVFGDASAATLTDSAIAALPHGLWSSVWFATSQARLAALPNTLTMIVLASNFGTFLLYMLSCIICIVAYQGHPNFSAVKHLLVPIFGVVANLVCMAFYLIGPFMGYGTKMEPFGALGIAAVWGIYGAIYFTRASRATGRTTLVASRAGRV
jgi:hypothetical protein